jgi:hypothetical protein
MMPAALLVSQLTATEMQVRGIPAKRSILPAGRAPASRTVTRDVGSTRVYIRPEFKAPADD